MTRALVIGQSHCNSIAQALADHRGRFRSISVRRFKDKRPTEDAISIDDAIELVGSLPEDSGVFLAVLGGYHNLLGLVRSGETFDFFVDQSDTPDLQANVRVPHRAIVSAFEEQFDQAEKIRRLIAAANCPLFLLSSPPPKRDNEFIFERFKRPKNRVYRGKLVEEFGVERPESRLKLWRLEERLMSEWAESQGMQFVPAPRGAFDASGFLKEAYYEDDVTHANSGYGVLVLEQIAAILRNSGQQVLNG